MARPAARRSKQQATATAAAPTLLLDTHVLIWLVAGSSRLGELARAAIDRAADALQLWVSVITPWEIAMLVAKGRLQFDRDVMVWTDAALALPGIRLAALEPVIIVSSTRLPGEWHADPVDRIIVATARELGASLVAADAALLAYAECGHLAAVAA